MDDLRKSAWKAMQKHPGHADQSVHGRRLINGDRVARYEPKTQEHAIAQRISDVDRKLRKLPGGHPDRKALNAERDRLNSEKIKLTVPPQHQATVQSVADAVRQRDLAPGNFIIKSWSFAPHNELSNRDNVVLLHSDGMLDGKVALNDDGTVDVLHGFSHLGPKASTGDFINAVKRGMWR